MIIDTPLASARDLASLMGIGTPGIYTSLGELSEARLVDSDSLGWSRPRTARWFLTEKGLARLGRTGSSWHEEAHRCGLLQRCPSVEWFYQVAGSMDDLGSFESFQWFDNLSFDAVARYERGWVALFWSGTLQPVDLIAGRLRQFGPDLLDMAVTLEVPWPGQLVFVVSDQWQGELVMQAARQYYLEDQVSVWCAADGSRSGARECGPSRGRVHQVVYPRGLGGWPWEKRLTRSPWAERGGLAVGRILDTVVQWPGMTTALGAQVLNEGITGRSAQKSLTRLLGHGLLHRQLGQGRYRYAATSGGVDCLARRDRVHFSQCKSHIDDLSWVDQPRVRAHRDQILSFISHFLAADMGVAAGWRAWGTPRWPRWHQTRRRGASQPDSLRPLLVPFRI